MLIPSTRYVRSSIVRFLFTGNSLISSISSYLPFRDAWRVSSESSRDGTVDAGAAHTQQCLNKSEICFAQGSRISASLIANGGDLVFRNEALPPEPNRAEVSGITTNRGINRGMSRFATIFEMHLCGPNGRHFARRLWPIKNNIYSHPQIAKCGRPA